MSTAKLSNDTFESLLDKLDKVEASKKGSNQEKLQQVDDTLGIVSETDPRYQTLQDARNALVKDKYTPTADLSQFEGLLGKLEASKMKQAGSAALDTRRNTYATGLAQMMNNF